MSKILNWVLSLVLFFAFSVFAQVVTPSKSTLTLPPLEGLTNENSLRQAGRIAEIAVGEFAADVAALVKEETALIEKTVAYEKTKKSEQEAFDIIKEKYDNRHAKYESINAPLTARILKFNALPPDQRDAETRSQLEAERIAIEPERLSLEVEKTAGDKSKAEGEARLKVIRDPLQVKITAWNSVKLPRMGLAYRQLKLCADYAAKINKKLEVDFNIKEVRSPVLNGAMEQLKALSGRGWDTP